MTDTRVYHTEWRSTNIGRGFRYATLCSLVKTLRLKAPSTDPLLITSLEHKYNKTSNPLAIRLGLQGLSAMRIVELYWLHQKWSPLLFLKGRLIWNYILRKYIYENVIFKNVIIRYSIKFVCLALYISENIFWHSR